MNNLSTDSSLKYSVVIPLERHCSDVILYKSSRCLERGFNSAKLLCSSCQDLKQFELGAVMADCEACCTDDGGASTLDNVKYERAILEVCG